jgi:hypothetical protein
VPTAKLQFAVRTDTAQASPTLFALERDVLLTVELRRYELNILLGIVRRTIVVVRMMARRLLLGHAAAAVMRRLEAVQTPIDDAFSEVARDVGDAGNSGAVPAERRVRVEWHDTATTYKKRHARESKIQAWPVPRFFSFYVKAVCQKKKGKKKIKGLQLSRSR